MKKNIDELRTMGYLDRMKVLVGGAPVSREYASKIGADGYGRDASEAVQVGLQLLEQVKASA